MDHVQLKTHTSLSRYLTGEKQVNRLRNYGARSSASGSNVHVLFNDYICPMEYVNVILTWLYAMKVR